MKEKGISLIEISVCLMISLVLITSMSQVVSLIKSYKTISQRGVVDESFKHISNLIYFVSCNSFIGMKLEEDKEKTEVMRIKDNSNITLYKSKKDPEFDLKKDGLSLGVVINEMHLEHPETKSDYAHFLISYSYKDQTFKRKLKIYLSLDEDQVIRNCSPQRCNEKKIKANLTEDLKEACKSIEFSIPESISGESFRKIEENDECLCIGTFHCYEGYLSHGTKCIKK